MIKTDLKNTIKNKFIRKCPNTNEYKERMEKELDLIIKKIFEKWDNVVRISNYVRYKDKGAIRRALKEK